MTGQCSCLPDLWQFVDGVSTCPTHQSLGTHFINGLWGQDSNLVKHADFMIKAMISTRQNFTYVMTAQLLCHVQNFGDWVAVINIQTKIFLQDFNYKLISRLWNGPLWTHNEIIQMSATNHLKIQGSFEIISQNWSDLYICWNNHTPR